MRALLVALSLIAGCHGKLVVTCNDASTCVRGGQTGECLPSPTGSGKMYCAFQDPNGCLQWDATAGEALAGTCVGATGGGAYIWTRRSVTSVTHDLRAVWVADSGTIWTAGDSDRIYRIAPSTYDLQFNSFAQWGINALWGPAMNPNFIVAVGEGGFVSRFNGAAWKDDANPDSAAHALRGVSGTAWNNIYAVGDDGTILHFNGLRWTLDNDSLDSNQKLVQLRAVGVTGGEALIAGDSNTLLRRGLTGWVQVQHAVNASWYGIWGTQSATYVVGDPGIMVRSGDTSWGGILATTDYSLTAIWGSSPDLFAVGQGGVILYSRDGQSWTLQSTPLEANDMGAKPNLYAVWGTNDGATVYVVGEAGTFLVGERQ